MTQPGEIYIANFGPAGPHPVIVVSREELNRGHYVLAVVCTSARFATRSKLANCVPFQAGEFGFTVDCVAQCENLLSIDKAQLNLAVGIIGKLDEATMQKIIKAIGYVIKSECTPL